MAENHSNSDIALKSNIELIKITEGNTNVNDAHEELKRRLEEYASLDSFDAYKDRLEDIQALAEKYKLASEEKYANFANQLLNKIDSYRNDVEKQQQNKSTNGNEDAVKKAEQALEDYLKEEYKNYLDVNYTDVESVSANDTLNYEQWKEKNIDSYKNNEEYKKLAEALEEAKGTKPQQQENSEVKTYTAEELKTLMHNQTNALYNREGLGAADFAKFHEEGKKILEAFVKGEVNVDSSAYTEMSGFINVFAGEYGDNNDEMKKLYDDATNKLESIKAEAENKNDQENETNEQKENSVDSNESEKSSQPSQDGDQGGDQGDNDQGGDQGEGSEADKTEQKDHSQNSDQGIKITRDNALDVLNKQFHRLRPEEIIELRKIIKEEHSDQLNNLDKKIIDKTQTFLAGETVILQTSQLYHLNNLLDSVREDNKDDGKGSTNQIGLSAANLKNEVGQRIKDFEELYGLDEQSRVDDEQIAKNVELLKDLPSFERVTYKESEAINDKDRVNAILRRNSNIPPAMDSIVGALKSDGLAKVDEDRLLDLAVAKIKDVKKADLIKNEDIADFQYLLGAVKKSRPKVKVGKQEELLFNAKKEYEKNHENKDLSDDLKAAYDVLDRITVIGGTDPYGKRKVKGQEAEDIKNTFKEQCRLETEMFFANTNKGEKIDPKEFEKEYALRLQMGLLKLVNYEEASKLTAMKEDGEKDIAKAFENAFESKKKIKISTVAFSAYHATEQDAINTACQKSPKALSAYVSSKNNNIEEQNKSQLKRVFSLGKGLLESAGWATAFSIASKAPPLGVAIVAGLSFAKQTHKLIKDFKQKREEEKQQGREYKFKDFVKDKENRGRMVGYALSAASTGLAIAAAAIPGANAALLMTARSATMMMSLGLGVKTTIDNMKKAKSWKEKLLIAGTFVATIAVGRIAGKTVQEVMANNFGDPVVPDAVTGADQSTPPEASAQLSAHQQEIQGMNEDELAFRYSQITGRNPEGVSIEQMRATVLMSEPPSTPVEVAPELPAVNEVQQVGVFRHLGGLATDEFVKAFPDFEFEGDTAGEKIVELQAAYMNGELSPEQAAFFDKIADTYINENGTLNTEGLNAQETHNLKVGYDPKAAAEAARREETVEIKNFEPRRLDSIPVEEPEITLKTKSDLNIVEVEELDIKGGTRVKVEGETILGDAYSDRMKLDASVKAEISEQGLAGVGKIDVDKYVFNDNETITIEGDRLVAGVKQDIVSVINKEGQYISVTVNGVPVPQEQLDTFNNNPSVLESNNGIYAKVTEVQNHIEDSITNSMVEKHTGIKPNTTNTLGEETQQPKSETLGTDTKGVPGDGAKDNSNSTETPTGKTQEGGNGATVHSFTVNYSAASDQEFQSTLQDGLKVYQDSETGKLCLGKEGCEPIAEADGDRGLARLNNLKTFYAAQAGADEAHYQELLAQGEEKLDAGAKQWMENHDKEMAEKWGLTRVEGKLYNPEQLIEHSMTKNYGSVLPSALGGEQVEVPEAFANTEHELRKVDDELTICWDKENGWSVRGLTNETGDSKDLNNDPIVKAYNAIQNKEDNGTQLSSFEKEFIKYADDRFQKLGISFDDNNKVVIANNEELGVPYQPTSMMANTSLNGAEDNSDSAANNSNSTETPTGKTQEGGNGATVHSFTVNYSAASDQEFQSTLQDGLKVYQDSETGKLCLGKEGCEPIAEADGDRGLARLNNLKTFYAAQAGADEAHYQELLAQGEEKLDAGAKQWMENHDKEMAEKWGLTRVEGKLYNPEQLIEHSMTKNYGSVLPSALGGEQVEVPEAFANTEHELRKVDDELTICWDKENGWSVRGLTNETGDSKDLNNDPIVKAYNAIQNKEDNGTQLSSFEKEFIKYADDRFQKLGISFDDNNKVVIANNEELGVPYQPTSMMANTSLNGAEDNSDSAANNSNSTETPTGKTQEGGNGAGANIGKHISELSKKGVNNKLESDTEIGKEKGTNPSLNKTNSYSSNNGSGGKGVYGINPNLNKGSTR